MAWMSRTVQIQESGAATTALIALDPEDGLHPLRGFGLQRLQATSCFVGDQDVELAETSESLDGWTVDVHGAARRGSGRARLLAAVEHDRGVVPGAGTEASPDRSDRESQDLGNAPIGKQVEVGYAIGVIHPLAEDGVVLVVAGTDVGGNLDLQLTLPVRQKVTGVVEVHSEVADLDDGVDPTLQATLEGLQMGIHVLNVAMGIPGHSDQMTHRLIEREGGVLPNVGQAAEPAFLMAEMAGRPVHTVLADIGLGTDPETRPTQLAPAGVRHQEKGFLHPAMGITDLS